MDLLIALTTVDSAEGADRLARGAVAAHLAVCAQVEGSLTSHYLWEGRQETASEWRVVFKLLPARETALAEWVHEAHPYAVPQWLVCEVARAGEKYLSWARATDTPVNL